MTRLFVTPKPEELAEAGALDVDLDETLENPGASNDAAAAATVSAEGVPENGVPGDVVPEADVWQILEGRNLEEILQYAAGHFADEPERRRELLAASMARALGYGRLIRRRRRVSAEPLWDVIAPGKYAELGEAGERALWALAQAMRPHRTTLHPMAALAAIALWRNTRDDELRQGAEQILRRFALPDEPRWLYELVRELERGVPVHPAKNDNDQRDDGKDAAAANDTATHETRGDDAPNGNTKVVERPAKDLEALVRLTLEARFWEVAALLCGLHLVRKYAQWYTGSEVSNLIRACDISAQQHAREDAVWLQMMADAAMGGRLTFAWLEQPIKACVRFSVADAARQRALREFDALRLYDADYRRLDALYGPRITRWVRGNDAEDYRRLVAEVEQTARTNPTRAQRLVELMLARRNSRRVGTLLARIEAGVERAGRGESLDELERMLVALYVRNYAVEGHAVALVRRAHDRLDWTGERTGGESGGLQLPGASELEMYLVISDYERAFEQLTCKFDGVTMEHADKDAAARIKIFVERRLDPNRINRFVRTMFAPMEWLGANLAEVGLIAGAVEHGIQRFEQRNADLDLREQVVEDFRAAGVALDDFDAIARLAVDRVDRVLDRQRSNRLLLGAVAGGISGGLAPFSWGVLSLADIPVLLGLTGDICSRFCWYYGFDPREHPELPMEILAVALGGSQPAAIEPMLLRQNLRDYVVHKSVMVGAVAHGGVKHLAGRSINQLFERQLGARTAERISAIARREVSRNLQRRAAEAAPGKTLPVVGALLGATLNVALLYDVCEAAQAVLTDRFLERKYPEWIRHIEGRRS